MGIVALASSACPWDLPFPLIPYVDGLSFLFSARRNAMNASQQEHLNSPQVSLQMLAGVHWSYLRVALLAGPKPQPPAPHTHTHTHTHADRHVRTACAAAHRVAD